MAPRQLKQTISDFTIRDAMSNRSSNCIHRQSQSQLDKSNHCRDRVRPSRTHLHLKLSQLSNKQGMCKRYATVPAAQWPFWMTRLAVTLSPTPKFECWDPLIVLFDMCCQFESIVFKGSCCKQWSETTPAPSCLLLLGATLNMTTHWPGNFWVIQTFPRLVVLILLGIRHFSGKLFEFNTSVNVSYHKEY